MLLMLSILRARAFVRVSHAVARPCVHAENCLAYAGAPADWRTAVGAVPDIASGKLSVQAGPHPAAFNLIMQSDNSNLIMHSDHAV